MFTENWARFYPLWQRWLGQFAGKAVCGIEIGCFEGRSTCWLFDHILTHPASWLHCVDPFQSFDGIPGDYKARFMQNTAAYRNRLCLWEMKSNELPGGGENHFDFAIIDGSHQAADVLEDAILVWHRLKAGGVMVFDDYEWQGQGHASCAETDKPRLGIDAFLSVYQPKVLHKGYQVIVEKQ